MITHMVLQGGKWLQLIDLARDLHYSPVWMSQVLRQLLWRGYVIRTNVRRAGWQWRYEAKEQAA